MSKGTELLIKTDVTVPFTVTPGTPVDILIPVKGYSPGDASGVRGPSGYGSLDLTFTAATTGTLAGSILATNGTVTYSVPYNYSDFFTGQTSGCVFPFQYPLCNAIKIRLTATNDVITVTRCFPAIG